MPEPDGQRLDFMAKPDGCQVEADVCRGIHDCPEPIRCAIDYLHDIVGADPKHGVTVVGLPGGYRVRRALDSDSDPSPERHK